MSNAMNIIARSRLRINGKGVDLAEINTNGYSTFLLSFDHISIAFNHKNILTTTNDQFSLMIG